MTRLFSYLVLIISMMGFTHSAYAIPVSFTATLDGPSEDSPNSSPGTGFADVIIDIMAHSLRVNVTFSDLVGTVTAAHIHAATATPGTGTAGVATTTPTFTGFPSGSTSGSYDHTFDTALASSYNPSFLNNIINGGDPLVAQATLFQAIAEGRAYLNIHTSVFGGGEIRGFLAPKAVPEPAINILMALGVLGFLFVKRNEPLPAS